MGLVWSGDGATVHDAVPSLWVWFGRVTGQQFMTRFHLCSADVSTLLIVSFRRDFIVQRRSSDCDASVTEGKMDAEWAGQVVDSCTIC